MIGKVIRFIDPIARLGRSKPEWKFALLASFLTAVFLESAVIVFSISSANLGLLAISLFIGLIIYFSFRDGFRGGLIATTVTVLYYLYIIYTRHYSGDQLSSGLATTALLGTIYLVVAAIIGYLKATIDKLLEREKNERRRLQVIVQQLPVGVVIIDDKGKVSLINKQLEEMLGSQIPIGSTIVDQSAFRELYRGGKRVPLNQLPIIRVMKSGLPIVGREYEVHLGDKKRDVQIGAVPIQNASGRVVATVSMISDITGRKELEKRKDDFVNIASHELKTPITSIKLFLNAISPIIRKTTDSKAIKMLESLNDQTDRLQRLVNDLLDVSRLQTGKMVFSRETFRLDSLIQEVVWGLSGMANDKRLVVNHLPKVQVKADRFRIYQVLTNLVTNAIKYSPNSDKIIINLVKEGKCATVSIQDFGIGIAKNEQSKIFNRLYQVSDDHSQTFPGFGMGLFIAKQIVRRHEGKIWVQSEKGKGATFFFSLPTS